MTAGKNLAIIALLVGATSLAMAQSTVKTGQQGPKQPHVANPYMQAAPWGYGSDLYMSAPWNSDLYMSAPRRHYRARTGQQGPKQPQ
jgi:hypothetical protein